MPSNQAERVVEGARHLSPFLGKRMRAVNLMHKSVFVRELAPHDLKNEIKQLTPDEAMVVARHSRQSPQSSDGWRNAVYLAKRT
jgi:uncharacterized protein (DUF2252 family)